MQLLKNFLIFSLIVCLWGCTNEKTLDNEKASPQEFTNPILAGFYPDPSICRVEDSYYLVTSSFSYFPGLPVFESKDLVHWKQLGHAMDRPSQLDTEGQRVSEGLFAPAISYDEGTFYLVCTHVGRKGNFVMTTEDPAGPWSDPVSLPQVNGIDPSLFFDDDGKSYLVYNSTPPNNASLYSGHRTIRMRSFDKKSLTVSEEEIILVNGGVDISKNPVWIEGPHIYKINDFYYLMCAEGGTGYNHSEVIFRSKSVKGPYEPWGENPILTQRDLDPSRPDPVTTTGHADMVQTQNGEWWAVFLACRPYEGNHFNTGRETFLAPVHWEDGWPVINPDFKEVQYRYPLPDLPEYRSNFDYSGNFSFTDEFDSSDLAPNFIFLRTPGEKWHQIEDGSLKLRLRPEATNGLSNPSFVAHRQQHLKGNVSTKLDFSAQAPNEKAGLIIFQNESHYYFLCRSVVDGDQVVELHQATEEGTKVLASAPLGLEERVDLKIEADGSFYHFHYNTGSGWSTLKGGVDAKFLSTETAGGFVGCVYGMYATSSGSPSENQASFEWFTYEGKDELYQ